VPLRLCVSCESGPGATTHPEDGIHAAIEAVRGGCGSYPANTRKATLVHELGHRLIATVGREDVEDHPILFLFLYDVWIDLWGNEFADVEVQVESRRRGLYDYESAWKTALSMTPAERASKFREFAQRKN
jgi:hypothetical protein